MKTSDGHMDKAACKSNWTKKRHTFIHTNTVCKPRSDVKLIKNFNRYTRLNRTEKGKILNYHHIKFRERSAICCRYTLL